MTLLKLTRETDNEPIYVNPAQVVLVTPGEFGGTRIVTTANAAEGPHALIVTERMEDVVSRLDGHYPMSAAR